MPQYIVKPDRETDFYVYWDTVTDGPWAWGTRADLEQEHYPLHAERFDRADATGTSSVDGFFDYADDQFIVHNLGPEPFLVSRVHLTAWLASLTGDGGPATTWDASLTKPIDREDR